MLRVIYTFFTGLLLATFVGVGIAAFYTPPTPPEYPRALEPKVVDATGQPQETAEEREKRQEAQDKFDEEQKAHQKAFATYARNVSMIALGFAIIFLIVSLSGAEKLLIIADGFLLGGLLTLLYSVGWGFATEDNRYRFLFVTIGLLVALALGYLKFIRPAERRPSRRS